MKPTGIDRFFVDAAYVAALMVYLIENKSDHETDAEIAEILTEKTYMADVVIGVMQVWKL